MSDTNALAPASSASMPATPQRIPEIAKALAAARKLCKPVEKTAWNSFLKVHYAPAEAIIETAVNALKEAGLCLIPVKSVVNGHQKEGPDRLELENTYLLVHEASGEYMPVVRAWPISQEKGTTLLKSTCATDTVSLAYYYRALLAIARVDAADDPMSSPPETQTPAPAPAPAQQATQQPPVRQTPAQPASELPLQYLAREHHRNAETIKSILIAVGENNLPGLDSVPADKQPRVRQLIVHGLARSVQVDRIMELREKLGIATAMLQERLRSVYHVDGLGHLSYLEAEEVEAKFRAALAAKGVTP